MEWLVVILNFIGQQVLNVPAYLIGIITALGLIALRRNAGQVIGGGLKAAVGFLILGAGATVVVGSLKPLGELILAVTGAQGVIPTNEVITAMAQEQFGAQSAYVLTLGFIFMLVLARFTPLKYVFLTGHHMVFMATMITVVLSVGFGQDSVWLVVLIGAILLASSWSSCRRSSTRGPRRSPATTRLPLAISDPWVTSLPELPEQQ